MATFVQSKASESGGYVQTTNITPNSSVTAGNILYLAIGIGTSDTNPVSAVTDTQGNEWVKIGSASNENITSDVWFTVTSTTGSNTITVTSASANYYSYALNFREYHDPDGDAINYVKDTEGYTADSGYVQAHSATTSNSVAADENVAIVSTFTSASNETYSLGSGLGNLLTQGTGSNVSGASADKFGVTLDEPASGSLNSLGYTKGVTWIVVFGESSGGITAPGPNYTPDWYDYGWKPQSHTVAQLKQICVDYWYDNVKQYIISTGMPAGLTNALRVVRPENSNDTVSEGIGYAMIAAVLIGNNNLTNYDPEAHEIFDKLYKYAKHFFNGNGLMSWHINSSGVVIDSGSATDGDYDIAWALHLAEQTWPNSGAYDYAAERDAMLTAILAHDHYAANHATVSLRNVMINGDAWDTGATGNPNQYAPDYVAPMYYEAWSSLNSRWGNIKTANYPIFLATFTGGYSSYGFIPDWQTRAGVEIPGQSYVQGYNAARRFRQAIDYLNYGAQGTNTAEVYAWLQQRLSGYLYFSFWRTNPDTPVYDVENLRAEYELDLSGYSDYINSLFIASYLPLLLMDEEIVPAASPFIDWLVANPDGSYFGDTVTMMSLLTAAGMMTPEVQAEQNLSATPTLAGIGTITGLNTLQL